MFKRQVKAILRSQKGFTLIELLAVMVIVAVLAGIITTSVSGTSESASVANAQSDAITLTTAAGTFFADQVETEVLTPKTLEVTAKLVTTIAFNPDGSVAAITTDDPGSSEALLTSNQEISNRWPELYIAENLSDHSGWTNGWTPPESVPTVSVYSEEFPTAGALTDGLVVKVIVADGDGAAIVRNTFLEAYTAIDFAKLLDQGYIASIPDSAEQVAEVTVASVSLEIHNFLPVAAGESPSPPGP